MYGWTDPGDPDAPYRRPSAPTDPTTQPTSTERWRSDGSTGWPVAGVDPPPAGHRRRHRAPRRIPRSITVAGAAAVATLVVAVGAGVVLLPRRTGTPPLPAAAGAPVEPDSDATGLPADSPSSPAPTATTSVPGGRQSTTAPARPAPTRKATSVPRRSPGRPPAGGGGDERSGGTAPADSRETEVVTLVNQERVANGCGPVQVNDELATAARLHSQDQATHDTMSHTGSDGSSPWDRAERAGYQQAIGENVAAGYRTPDAVMDGWMNSPGHRANILNCQAKALGVGVAAASDGTLYWTQLFGSAP